jgi:hypothetical protein
MTERRYTELFFLDEATAFAAGHRPCAERRRERFNFFKAAWQRAKHYVICSSSTTLEEAGCAAHGALLACGQAPERIPEEGSGRRFRRIP